MEEKYNKAKEAVNDAQDKLAKASRELGSCRLRLVQAIGLSQVIADMMIETTKERTP